MHVILHLDYVGHKPQYTLSSFVALTLHVKWF